MALSKFEGLTELEDIATFDCFGKLPPLFSPFSVPFLEDRPQNPIVQKCKNSLDDRVDFADRRNCGLPKELLILSEEMEEVEEAEGDVAHNFWEDVGLLGRSNEGRIASWDNLRKAECGLLSEETLSPFLSEQSVHVTSAARFHIRPTFSMKSRRIWHLSSTELLLNLSATLLGCSSTIYVWDASEERFLIQKDEGEEEAVIFLESMDETVSASYIHRFLVIGTLLRRLESLAFRLREMDPAASEKHVTATSFAFGHALTSVVALMQKTIRTRLADIKDRGSSRLIDFWLGFEDIQNAAENLSSLCGLELGLSPNSYVSHANGSSSDLLSLIYRHLAEAHRRCGGQNTLAFGLLAYIITVTSKPYFSEIAREIGLDHRQDSASLSTQKSIATELTRTSNSYGGQKDTKSLAEEGKEFDSTFDFVAFPVFISPRIREAVIRAKRSIHILSLAGFSSSPNAAPANEIQLQWRWGEEELLWTADGEKQHCATFAATEGHHDKVLRNIPERSYPVDIAEVFRAFDLEPGSHLMRSTSAISEQSSTVEEFISKFPSTLASFTPSLPLLVDRMLDSIVPHANALGSASLRIFFGEESEGRDGDDLLQFKTHVTLLRSYLLMMSGSFRELLQSALFSDKTPGEDEDQLDIRAAARRAGKKVRHGQGTSKKIVQYPSPSYPWVAGLSRGLFIDSNGDQQGWPPGGSDLSFYLRRVILDSLERVKLAEFPLQLVDSSLAQIAAPTRNGFWDDVEGRLGFAIRELPSGGDFGKGKWMEPNSIEALDFLFMDYKPPLPLRSLITKEILSKYQRMFTFLLRLTRVQSAIRAVYRAGRRSDLQLFISSKASRRLFDYFLFAAQGFISALSTYVSHTAIGGNMDAFIAKIAAAEGQTRMRSKDETHPSERQEPMIFEDVHALSQAHSKTLNDVLSACLQRSSQQVYGDGLKGCLDALLEFCSFIADLVSGKLGEGESGVKLVTLWKKWSSKVSLLVRILHKLVDKGATPAVKPVGTMHTRAGSDIGGAGKPILSAPGGIECLTDLLIRLDYTDWWKDAPMQK